MNPLETWFEQFWQTFPADLCHRKKGSQKKAWIIIEKLAPDKAMREKILGNLRELIRFYRAEEKAKGKTDRWPMVTTWLNGECFNNLDDIGYQALKEETTRQCKCGNPTETGRECGACYESRTGQNERHDKFLYAQLCKIGLGKKPGEPQKEYVQRCKDYVKSSATMGSIKRQRQTSANGHV